MHAVWKLPPSHRKYSLPSHTGFTLVELMVVVVIIAILIGLVLPAITGVRTRAREAQVINDISQLEKAITAFKVDFGIDPPSRITFYALPANPMGTTPNWDNDPADPLGCVRSKAFIKQIWPKFDFTNCGGASNGATFPGVPGNINRLDLNGSECLVFFLGGMIDGASGAFSGFSKDRTRPFAPRSVISNREGPYFEFNGALKVPASATAGDGNWSGRLTDKDNDWLPEYKDTLPQQTMPYVYFNASSGSYRTNSGAPPTGPANPTPTPNWYNTDGFPFLNFAYYSSVDPASPRASAPYKPRGFQIISPGSDGIFGTGGKFNPDDTSNLSRDDRDNLTNFHSGRLAN